VEQFVVTAKTDDAAGKTCMDEAQLNLDIVAASSLPTITESSSPSGARVIADSALPSLSSSGQPSNEPSVTPSTFPSVTPSGYYIQGSIQLSAFVSWRARSLVRQHLRADRQVALWQEVDTTGVTSLAIDFTHVQRQKVSEQISVWVGASAPPQKKSKDDVIDWETLGFTRVLEATSDYVEGWHQYYQMMVQIPIGQEKTYVAFETNGEFDGSIGNFLDDVKLSAANGVLLSTFDVQLFDADDVNLEEAKLTLTNVEIGDTLGLGGFLQSDLTFMTMVENGAIEIHVTGSASLAVYKSIVDGVGFSSSSTVAELASLL
jgi:hypothetical protein